MRSTWLALALLVIAGCGSEDAASVDDSVRWRRVFDQLPGALISVSGTSEKDVWTVGGDPGTGATVLHFDGAQWRALDTGMNVDLWWVHPFAGGPVFFGGSQGTILRWQGGSFEKMTTPSDATVFGIWGTSPDDLWAVGGVPAEPGKAFVWRWDGSTWSVASGLPKPKVASYFKVWGRSADDVRIVGMDGAILEWDGTSFSEAASPTTTRLLTLYAEPEGYWVAVGGLSNAVVLEDHGSGWQDVSPSGLVKASIGVRLAGEDGYAVGNGGSVLRRVDGTWQPEDTGIQVYGDFHATWIDPKGGVWAVGGDLLSSPLVHGVMLHKGPPVSASIEGQ
ncbi:MAG: hypothetical protein KC776_14980 [Myxococcales bacterium]|nr:hypothetical protein [Myxococcales bacterium]MCB9582716.1 hypothetical protein [Polyangiaceae bacterium]